MNRRETLCTMALTRLPRLSAVNARMLIEACGSAAAVVEHHDHLTDVLPSAGERLVGTLAHMGEAMGRAEAELDYAEHNGIRCLCIGDADYPDLLRQCPDAPPVLYYLGNADLNRLHVISVVGTRRCTEYGKDLCRHFIADLAGICPDTLVVSGLAYGVDIHAHRAALDCGLPTVGVLAHGLDTIYPSAHRQTAARMVEQGGLLTEYMSHAAVDKGSFVRRNRIVAGLAVATIVVESADKGGALITAELAGEYNREVCAFPGRVFDKYSEGCNRLIARQQARLITSVDDFLAAVGWHNPRTAPSAADARQQELFPVLTDDERTLLAALEGVDSKAVNQIVIDTNLPFQRVSALLFELEMKGLVAVMGGARYRKVRTFG